jgi:DNA end-binding protein Ku
LRSPTGSHGDCGYHRDFKKQAGQPIAAAKKQAPSNVVNLMDALRASIKGGDKSIPRKGARAKKIAKKRKAS